MTEQHIYGMDPGLTTGWAEGRVTGELPFWLDTSREIPGGVSGWATSPEGEAISEGMIRTETLVVESFELSSGNDFTADLHGVEIIGYLKGSLGLEHPSVVYRRRDRKHKVPDDLLKRHGLWQDSRHVNDAIIHILSYLHSIGHKPTIRKYFLEET